ncbi:MAG: tetratricopeptide repeat protein [Deltaproteobacteria bacterium]|nr:tetratricopeptide repeat protein [Deltaproteobacteria bacterium]
MADKKKPAAKGKSRAEEPELDLDDLDEQIEKGQAELPRQTEADIDELYTLSNIEKFMMGEITWAELQGITVEEAYNIAEYGYALYQEGRFHDARTVFEGLVLCNPYDSYFHNMLGATYQQLDLKDEAVEQFSLAIDMDAENLHAYINRAELLLKNGEFERALTDLKRAVALDPEGKDAAGLRARALMAAAANALDALRDIMNESKKTTGKKGK